MNTWSRAATITSLMLATALTACTGQAGPPLASEPPPGRSVTQPVETITPQYSELAIDRTSGPGSVEGQQVHDGGAETLVAEGFGPAGEGFVGRDSDGVLLLPLGEHLEEEFGAAANPRVPSDPRTTPLSRSEARIPSRHRAATTLAAAHERFTLTDGHGTTLMTAHSNSLSDGPFGGILYLAFPSDGQFDLGTPLTLKSENAEVIFQL